MIGHLEVTKKGSSARPYCLGEGAFRNEPFALLGRTFFSFLTSEVCLVDDRFMIPHPNLNLYIVEPNEFGKNLIFLTKIWKIWGVPQNIFRNLIFFENTEIC